MKLLFTSEEALLFEKGVQTYGIDRKGKWLKWELREGKRGPFM